jgi:hypothetical protein
MMMMMMI